ncbi:hypothetical protein HD_1343 [[Haemophilus] ducreyi 35000HP]|uniref:Uncharacterized protein n=1 Tax=Haemophilus ducreyi (strain 35000HP / ATCC 700724) TaxID=233412 RepID=Q7VLS5_HAEDU|nr:hypothetical protein HD_1343 [[Haemophilus] ducreyi 35000HP]
MLFHFSLMAITLGANYVAALRKTEVYVWLNNLQ